MLSELNLNLLTVRSLKVKTLPTIMFWCLLKVRVYVDWFSLENGKSELVFERRGILNNKRSKRKNCIAFHNESQSTYT